MASGLVHHNHTKKIAVVTTIIGSYFSFSTLSIVPLLIVTIGNVLGVILNNDTDVPGGTYSEFLVENYVSQFAYLFGVKKSISIVLGRIIKKIFMISTFPYALLAPHRSWISHSPVVGSVGRALYCYGFYYIICSIFNWQIIPLLIFWNEYYLFWILVVWECHSFTHTFFDGFMIVHGGILTEKGKYRYWLGKRFYQFIKVQTDKSDKKLREMKKNK